jgi:hypothetical protein
MSEHEVDACNAVINNLFYEQLGENGSDFIRVLSKVVGEMHDNVASHSRGIGFSSAQRYERGEGDVIQFAIVDTGVGMLRNVTPVAPAVTTDEGAIDWCLRRGNTTAARKGDGWEQRLPEDSLFSPYPRAVGTVRRSSGRLVAVFGWLPGQARADIWQEPTGRPMIRWIPRGTGWLSRLNCRSRR